MHAAYSLVILASLFAAAWAQGPPDSAAGAGADPLPAPRTTPEQRAELQAAHNAQSLAQSKTWALTKAQAVALRDPALEGKLRICVNPNSPYSFCNTTDANTTFTGYEPELFREIARRIPWLDDGTWDFQCVPISQLDDTTENGTCFLSMGGLYALSPSRSGGAKSSQSIAEAGFTILVRAKESQNTKKLFSPFYAFSWQLWLALVLTTVFVGVILWLFETLVKAIFAPTEEDDEAAAELAAAAPVEANGAGNDTLPVSAKVVRDVESDTQKQVEATHNEVPAVGAKRRRGGWARVLERAHTTKSEALTTLDKTLRQTLLNLARVTVLPPSTTLPSQIILWAWGLLTMITVSMFTGATAAGLTAASLNGGITSLADLRGRPVVVWEDQEDVFKHTGVITIPMPADTIEDEQAMLALLRSGRADAIVEDSNWVQFYAGVMCDLTTAGDEWGSKFVSFRFNMRMQQGLIDDINAAIVDAKAEDVVEAFQERYITHPAQACTKSKAVAKGPTIGFGQVAGLWVMMGIALTAASLLLLFLYLGKRSSKAVKQGVHRIKSHVAAKELRKPKPFQDVPGDV